MAEYSMQETVDLNNEGQTLVYPKLIIGQSVNSDELARQLTQNSTFSEGEILGIIKDLGPCIARNMADGRSVKIKGLGLFVPTLGYKKGVERQQADGEGGTRNATSLKVNDVKFRPENSLLNDINEHCKLRKSPRKFERRISPYSEEERLAKALAYIEEKGLMTLSEYTVLSGLSRSCAARELRKWAKDKTTGIEATGRAPHRVFVKRDEE